MRWNTVLFHPSVYALPIPHEEIPCHKESCDVVDKVRWTDSTILERQTYGSSVQVKTCEKPQERTSASWLLWGLGIVSSEEYL